MSIRKKTPSRLGNDYKIAAKARRDKIASIDTPIVGEVKPLQGRIRVTLGGDAITSGRIADIQGPSSIDIPEFSIYRKTESN